MKETIKSQIKKNIKESFIDEILIESFQSEHIKYAPSKLHINNIENPYFETPPSRPQPNNKNIVFITSRFRTGSTLLWNIFRNAPGFTSFYEPFNERRWFSKANRGESTDSTHKHVDNYWEEYDQLEHLSDTYDENWIRHQLYMDKDSHNPNMKSFIQTLIDSTEGDVALQFNRIDFRLPWIKHHFPEAKILHLYRHPREQWLSSLVDIEKQNIKNIDSDFSDYFYLKTWAQDLAMVFPVLTEWKELHPYELFYILWKLSYIFGQQHSDLSFSFEDVTSTPETILGSISTLLKKDIGGPINIINPTPQQKWPKYADEEWFIERESYCEEILNQLLR